MAGVVPNRSLASERETRSVPGKFQPMRLSRFLFLACLLVLTGVSRAASSAPALCLKLGLAESPDGNYTPAPNVVVESGQTASLQLPFAKFLLDYTFTPTLEGGNVRLVITSRCQGPDGKEIPSTLCRAYILPLDSSIRIPNGEHCLRLTVSRVAGDAAPKTAGTRGAAMVAR